MFKINISGLSNLRNQEFPDALASIITILESDVVTEEYVLECLNVAKAKRDKLGLLKSRRKGHPLSATLRELNYNRHDYLLSFKGKINYGLKSPIETERKAAKVLNVWLDRYNEHLSSAKIHEQNTLVDQLADDVDTNDYLAEALNDAGLMNAFDSIKMITIEIREVFHDRSKDREEHKRKAYDRRRDAYEAIKMLLNSLEMAIKLKSENSDIYVGYWNEISRLLDRFNAKVQSRVTRRKNAAEQDQTPIEDEVDVEDMDNMEDDDMGDIDNMDDDNMEGDNMDDVAEGDIEVTSTTPKSTMVMKSRPYSVVRLNESMDKDLQDLEKANEDWAATNGAMMESETINNDDVTTSDEGDTAKADDAETDNVAMDDATAGNGGLIDNASETSAEDGDTEEHDGANDQVAN